MSRLRGYEQRVVFRNPAFTRSYSANNAMRPMQTDKVSPCPRAVREQDLA
jgi:hypothetical protein